MIARQKQFECAKRTAAEEALEGLSDRAKVNFALCMMMKITDPDAAGVMSFASTRLAEMANVLMREAYESECG